jgi:tetrathionate reductase subunit B
MTNDSKPSRRTFLAVLPALTAGLAAPGAQAAQKNAPHWGMLVDTRRCIGCQACTMACAIENSLPEGQFRTFAATYVVTARDGRSGVAMVPRLCNQCDEPPCVPVCPVGATFKREDGLVLVDGGRCVGCGYCTQACPYEARFVNHETGKADKCTFCSHRLDAGLLPACVETCVGGSRVFGDLNDPASEISRRIQGAAGKTSVLKPEAGSKPNVVYIGLDKDLNGRVAAPSAVEMTWRPEQHGA